jgi:hypothetical protein
VGVPVAERAGRPPRLGGDAPRAPPAFYIFTAMYWPLIGGFVAFVLLAVLLGWVMDTSRHGGDANHDGH